MILQPALFFCGFTMTIFKNRYELIETVKAYADRDVKEINEKIPIWINITQDMLDRGLRHPALITTATYPAKAGEDSIPAPVGYNELKQIIIKDTGKILQRLGIEVLSLADETDQYPDAYCFLENRFKLNKPCFSDMDIEIIHYNVPKRLESDSDTNIYLTIAADIMLFNTVSELFFYDNNPQEAERFKAKADNSYNAMLQQIKQEEYGGSQLIIKRGSKNVGDYY